VKGRVPRRACVRSADTKSVNTWSRCIAHRQNTALHGQIKLGRKKEKTMKHKFAPLALVNRKSLPRAVFATVAVLLVSTPVCSATGQDPASNRRDPVPVSASNASASETLRGIVASTNERNDTLTIQLPSTGTTSDFKVRDGLIFNSVRYGDPVEITVETIDGARTITGLKRE
jgi:type II secretory pathway component PulC